MQLFIYQKSIGSSVPFTMRTVDDANEWCQDCFEGFKITGLENSSGDDIGSQFELWAFWFLSLALQEKGQTGRVLEHQFHFRSFLVKISAFGLQRGEVCRTNWFWGVPGSFPVPEGNGLLCHKGATHQTDEMVLLVWIHAFLWWWNVGNQDGAGGYWQLRWSPSIRAGSGREATGAQGSTKGTPSPQKEAGQLETGSKAHQPQEHGSEGLHYVNWQEHLEALCPQSQWHVSVLLVQHVFLTVTVPCVLIFGINTSCMIVQYPYAPRMEHLPCSPSYDGDVSNIISKLGYIWDIYWSKHFLIRHLTP